MWFAILNVAWAIVALVMNSWWYRFSGEIIETWKKDNIRINAAWKELCLAIVDSDKAKLEELHRRYVELERQ